MDGGCAISAGVFLAAPNGNIPPDWFGDYLFTDFCRGWLRALDPVTGATWDVLGDVRLNLPVTLAVTEDRSVLVLERGTGSIRVITMRTP